MRKLSEVVAGLLLLLPLAGCMVRSRHGENGDKDVDISTPLGGMSVKTDGNAVQRKLGLPLYPGAVLQSRKGDDNSSADVDMNFGAFHLRVVAMGFTTPDDPAKVREYYRKALAQYSDVIECRNHKPVGSLDRTGLGLTCTDDNHVHARTHENHDVEGTELKAGSESRQHIVSFRTKDGGTDFELVALELPRSGESGS